MISRVFLAWTFLNFLTHTETSELFNLQFLEQCETYGKSVKTVIEQPLEEVQLHRGKNTVTYEARLLKALLLQLEME